jgi:pteridine reductase
MYSAPVQALTVQPATPPTPGPDPKARISAGIWALGLAVLLLVGLMVLVAVLNSARRRRRAQERDRPRLATPSTPPTDAWAEAGKRVRTPTSQELEQGISRSIPPSAVPAPGVSPSRAPSSNGRPLVLITGAAKRVGRAIALRFARVGCDVFFTYHQSGEEAESLARELSALGSTGSFYQVDLSDPTQVEDFARDLSASLSKLDAIIHNASVYSASPLQDLSAEEIARHYQVNAAAPLLLTARLAPLLMQSDLPGGAAVIAFTDIHAMGRPRKDFAAYSMSKAAVTEMIYSLARDLGPEVRVNGIAPGVVAWPEQGQDADPDMQRKYIRRIPLGRPGTPDDAAEVVRWLAFDATYISGEIIRVDGGRWLT